MIPFTRLDEEQRGPGAAGNAPALVLELLEELDGNPLLSGDIEQQLQAWFDERERAISALLHSARLGREKTRQVARSLLVHTCTQNSRMDAAIKEATAGRALQRTLAERLALLAYRGLVAETVLLMADVLVQATYALSGSPWAMPPLALQAMVATVLLWAVTFLLKWWLEGACLRSFELSSREKDEQILQLLAAGVIKLLSCDWLRNSGVSVLRRRQDMPDEAFLSPEEAVAAWGMRKRLVAILSHRWFTKEHPDPHGFTLSIVCRFLATAPAVRAVALALHAHPCTPVAQPARAL